MRAITAGIVFCFAVGIAGVANAREDLKAINALRARVGELYGKGDYPEATKVAEQAVKVAERALGQDHLDTALCLHNLAGLYLFQGKYA